METTFDIKQKSNGAQPMNTTGNITTDQPLFLPFSRKEIAKDDLILTCKTPTKQTQIRRYSARPNRGLVPTPRIMHKGFSKEKICKGYSISLRKAIFRSNGDYISIK